MTCKWNAGSRVEWVRCCHEQGTRSLTFVKGMLRLVSSPWRCTRMCGLPWRPSVPSTSPKLPADRAASTARRLTARMPSWSYCSITSTRP